VEGPGLFHADTVLAKHDERYMPKEVADKLKQQGAWRNEKSARAQ
jgi:cytochrome c-type biogenesis protein CcmE